jgi:hypothetical protein
MPQNAEKKILLENIAWSDSEHKRLSKQTIGASDSDYDEERSALD